MKIWAGLLVMLWIHSCGKAKDHEDVRSEFLEVKTSGDAINAAANESEGVMTSESIQSKTINQKGSEPTIKEKNETSAATPTIDRDMVSYAAQRAEVTRLVQTYTFAGNEEADIDRPVCDSSKGSCEPGREVILPSNDDNSVPSGQVRVCSSQTYEMKKYHQEFAVLEPDHDVLWPGSLVQGASLTTGTLDPVMVSGRAPGVVSLAIQGNDGKSFSRVVERPDLKSVSDALNQILHEKKDQRFPAKFYLQTRSYYSDEQLATSVGVGFGASFAGFGGGVNVSVDKKKATQSNRVVLELTQKYFTAAFTPKNGAQFFKNDVTAEDLKPFTSVDNPMTYISSVTWGRRLYFVFESYASIDQLKVAVELYFNYLFFKVSTKVSHEHLNIIRNSSIRVMAVGGNASEIMEAILPESQDGQSADAFDLKNLKDYLIKGAEYSETSMGVPVSYTIRNLGDGTAVKVGLATEYTKRECELKHRNNDTWTLDIELLNVGVSEKCRDKPVFYHLSLDSGQADLKWQSVARGYINPQDWEKRARFPVYAGKRFQIPQKPGQSLTVKLEVDPDRYSSLLDFSSYKLLEKGSFLEWDGNKMNGEVITMSRETPCQPVLDYRMRWLHKG